MPPSLAWLVVRGWRRTMKSDLPLGSRGIFSSVYEFFFEHHRGLIWLGTAASFSAGWLITFHEFKRWYFVTLGVSPFFAGSYVLGLARQRYPRTYSGLTSFAIRAVTNGMPVIAMLWFPILYALSGAMRTRPISPPHHEGACLAGMVILSVAAAIFVNALRQLRTIVRPYEYSTDLEISEALALRDTWSEAINSLESGINLVVLAVVVVVYAYLGVAK
jgi:hypothetical protein